MTRYFLQLSYNGCTYNGWQKQENTTNTVQQLLEDKLGMILKEKVVLTGCGRTDTGVNARNYIAHFDLVQTDLLKNKQHWIYKFNTVLPAEIAIQDIVPVKSNAHARFDALDRQYFYFISQQKDPFRSSFSWYVYGELDFELMNKAAQILLEYQDFTSFSKLNSQNKTNICIVTKAMWQKSNEGEWRFTICANRFLRGMVRAIVGTMVMVGKNKMSLKEFREVIEAKNRAIAGNNAPPNALFLNRIRYPKELYIERH